MGTNHLSDNYHLRKHFLDTNEVPTQSLIKKKMSPSLAAVYFKSMSPKLKVLAGLEPSLKGGGNDWYVPPKDLLEGRSVLKPLKKECLSRLNYLGIDSIGMKMLQLRFKGMEIEKQKIIAENDERWKATVESECQKFFEISSVEAAEKNTERIKHAFGEFTNLFQRSINSIETTLFDVARNEMTRIQDAALQSMNEKCATLMQQQAVTLYDLYTNKLNTEKSRLKDEFVEKVSVHRTEIGQKIHDLKLDKHAAIEKLRQYLEYQTLACQVYVALKERETCENEIKMSKHMHKKKVKTLADEVVMKDFEILLHVQKDKKRQEMSEIWQKKICHVVQIFQKIILYSMNMLPEHAEFFLNVEKLMLLQLNEVLDNPSAESIIEDELEQFEDLQAKPHPFYIFCDKGRKFETKIKEDLCPKHCTSDTSEMPVIVVNKRCMYAACDNFQQFTNKIKNLTHDDCRDDADFIDENYVPVKYTPSQQLLELKLESSLLQLLQQELPNIREVPIECGICKMPHCFCDCAESPSPTSTKVINTMEQKPSRAMSPGKMLNTRSAELIHQREPKWGSYLKYIETKKCTCPKTTKQKLIKNLPVYMRTDSVYNTFELPNYEKCALATLKEMVKQARGYVTELPPAPSVSQTRDMATQCSDLKFDAICNCFSDDELLHMLRQPIIGSKMFHPSRTDDVDLDLLDSDTPPRSWSKRKTSFQRSRAPSVRAVLGDSGVVKDIFKSSGRAFD